MQLICILISACMLTEAVHVFCNEKLPHTCTYMHKKTLHQKCVCTCKYLDCISWRYNHILLPSRPHTAPWTSDTCRWIQIHTDSALSVSHTGCQHMILTGMYAGVNHMHVILVTYLLLTMSSTRPQKYTHTVTWGDGGLALGS